MSSLRRNGQIRTKRQGKRSLVKSHLHYLSKRDELTHPQYQQAISTLDALLAALPQHPTAQQVLETIMSTESHPNRAGRILPPEPTTAISPPAPPSARTPAQLAALAAAREKRACAAPRTAPEGWRSVEHLLTDTREYCGRRTGAVVSLATYLGVNASTVGRWLRMEKTPMQPTLEAIAQWRRNQAAGL